MPATAMIFDAVQAIFDRKHEELKRLTGEHYEPEMLPHLARTWDDLEVNLEGRIYVEWNRTEHVPPGPFGRTPVAWIYEPETPRLVAIFATATEEQIETLIHDLMALDILSDGYMLNAPAESGGAL